MNLFINYWKILSFKFRLRFISIIILSVIAMFFETAGITLVIPFISIFLYNDNIFNFLTNYSLFLFLLDISFNRLVFFILLFIFLFFLIKTIYLVFFSYFQSKFSYDLVAHFSFYLYKSYLYKPYSFHLNQKAQI